jgi:hypothetical protein
MAKPTKTAKKALPAALATRAAAAAATKKAALLREARALIAEIKRKRGVINEAYYEIGEAIARLRKRDMLAALGHGTFEDLCRVELGISVEVAARLAEVAETMTKEEAMKMGQSRAIALVDLSRATPEPDSPGQLYRRGKVAVPGGASVDTKKGSARALARAAREIRSAHDAGKPRRGRSTTSEEREFAAACERALRAAGIDEATVTAVATKPGQESYVRVDRVPVSKLPTAAKVLAKLRAPA